MDIEKIRHYVGIGIEKMREFEGYVPPSKMTHAKLAEVVRDSFGMVNLHPPFNKPSHFDANLLLANMGIISPKHKDRDVATEKVRGFFDEMVTQGILGIRNMGLDRKGMPVLEYSIEDMARLKQVALGQELK